MCVIHNTQRPELIRTKKSKSICYHTVRESVEMVETKNAHIYTHDNRSDLLIKVLYGPRGINLPEMFL